MACSANIWSVVERPLGIHYNIIPVTTGDFTHTLHKYEVLPEYTKNTRSYIMTYTGHDRRLYN